MECITTSETALGNHAKATSETATQACEDTPKYNFERVTAKGLVIDKDTCNVLKVSAARRIVGAFCGLVELEFDEIQSIYGKKPLHFSAVRFVALFSFVDVLSVHLCVRAGI